jgi:predicted hotdog family 3-hydroxylacyl-ACP dehydratase
MKQQQLPITDISQLIPQKTPFVMVDTLLDFSSNHVVSSFKVVENNLFLKNNILLESGLIENMAQTVALHTGYDFFLKNETAPTGYIGSIKKIDILKLPLLNDIITTKVDILHEFNGVTMVAVKVFNAVNEEIASGEMKTVIAN